MLRHERERRTSEAERVRLGLAELFAARADAVSTSDVTEPKSPSAHSTR